MDRAPDRRLRLSEPPEESAPGRRAFAKEFAAALAQRLDAVVPAGVTVSVNSSGDVNVTDDAGSSDGTGVVWIVDQPGPLDRNVSAAASATLNTVQDFVIKCLRASWPALPSGEVPPGRALPRTEVEVADAALRWRFVGASGEPVLELPPILLDSSLL